MTFFARGLPKAQPRVKAARIGGFTRVYTPKGADEWKSIIRMECFKVWDRVQFSGPVSLLVEFYFPRPKKHFKKGALRAGSPIFHDIRPDFDNLAKAVADALTNAGVWRDDSQIASFNLVKRYSNDDTNGARVSVEKL